MTTLSNQAVINKHKELEFFINDIIQNQNLITHHFAQHEELGIYESWFEKLWRCPPPDPEFLKRLSSIRNKHYSLLSSIRENFRGQSLSIAELDGIRIKNPDPAKREEAVKAYYSGLKQIIDNICGLFNELAGIMKERADQLECKPEAINDIRDGIKPEMTKTVVDAVSANFRIMHRFLKIKANMLGSTKLPPEYRIGTPVQEVPEQNYSWEEAEKIITNAFKNFNPKMGIVAEKFFHNGWIDARKRDNKSPRAFTYPGIRGPNLVVEPRIQTSFEGTPECVLSLAHELGHGIFEYIAVHEGNAGHMPISLVWEETISFLAECMVFDQLIRNVDNQYLSYDEELKLKQHLRFIHTQRMMNKIMDQVVVHKFEQEFHAIHDLNKRIEKDALMKIWLRLSKAKNGQVAPPVENFKYSFGAALPVTSEPFGVSAYAIGALLALRLWTAREEEGFSENFMEILEKGGDISVSDFTNLGWNLYEENFWHEGLEIVSEELDKLAKLCGQNASESHTLKM